ncbi:15866_t:CDS:2, partial [Racocetra persica]
WVISWFVPPPTKNDKKTEETRRWLTDKEIDWACGGMKEKQMPGSFPGSEVPSKFKILPAHQFHLVREAQRWNKEEELFTYLLSELTSGDCEIVFIPVNQTNYHWSLLVFETKSKKFYHWDSLGGANWG